MAMPSSGMAKRIWRASISLRCAAQRDCHCRQLRMRGVRHDANRQEGFGQAQVWHLSVAIHASGALRGRLIQLPRSRVVWPSTAGGQPAGMGCEAGGDTAGFGTGLQASVVSPRFTPITEAARRRSANRRAWPSSVLASRRFQSPFSRRSSSGAADPQPFEQRC